MKNHSPTAIVVILSLFRLIHLDNSFCEIFESAKSAESLMFERLTVSGQRHVFRGCFETVSNRAGMKCAGSTPHHVVIYVFTSTKQK